MRNLVQLVMIIKNGSDTIEQTLRSCLPFMDRWTILDTGSTDKTIEIINTVTAEFDNVPGQLPKEP